MSTCGTEEWMWNRAEVSSAVRQKQQWSSIANKCVLSENPLINLF